VILILFAGTAVLTAVECEEYCLLGCDAVQFLGTHCPHLQRRRVGQASKKHTEDSSTLLNLVSFLPFLLLWFHMEKRGWRKLQNEEL
jgi:hypothetical protein